MKNFISSYRVALLLCRVCRPASLCGYPVRIKKMKRDDVPLGKGQCDIRLQVDICLGWRWRSWRPGGDPHSVRPEARDDGSNAICRFRHDLRLQLRSEEAQRISLAEPPSRRNFAAIVRIRDSSGGFGRYHFRPGWAITAARLSAPDGTGATMAAGAPAPARLEQRDAFSSLTAEFDTLRLRRAAAFRRHRGCRSWRPHSGFQHCKVVPLSRVRLSITKGDILKADVEADDAVSPARPDT